MVATQQKLQQFCDETFEEFGHLGDYIWKFNMQIDELRSEELRSCKITFPMILRDKQLGGTTNLKNWITYFL